MTFFTAHHLRAGNCAVRAKLLSKDFVVNRVIKILDVKVDTLVSVQTLQFQQLKFLFQLLLAFGLLLCSADVKSFATHIKTIKFIDSFFSCYGILKADESKSFILSTLISHDHFIRSDFSIFREQFFQFFVSKFFAEVLYINVRELLRLLAQLLFSLLAGNKSADEHLLVVEQHAIDFLYSIHCGLLGLEVNESVSLAVTIRILSHLTGENVSESGERIVHGFVIDTLIQILDEHVANARSPKRRIPLTPHDPDGTALKHVEVHRIQCSFSISRLLEVNICISKRSTGDHISTNPD